MAHRAVGRLQADDGQSRQQYVLARSLRAFDDHVGRILCPLLTSGRTERIAPSAPPFEQALLTGTLPDLPK